MPPSPSSSSISSLAARFAFKPAEAAKVAAAVAVQCNATASPSRIAKRRLSSSATLAQDGQSPIRTSPRRSVATTTTSILDVKGKGKQAATTTTTSASTSVDLQDGTDLYWEIADEDIAAISDEVLTSNSNKKIKLDDVVLSSSPSVAIAGTSKVTSLKSDSGKPQSKTVPSRLVPKGNATVPSLLSSSADALDDTARGFLDGLSESPTAGTGGMLSHRQLLELESRTMDPSWLKELRKE